MQRRPLLCAFAALSLAARAQASPALVDSLRVDYYGSPTPLKQLATVGASDAQSLTIKPFDPGSLKDIEKAILKILESKSYRRLL